MTTISKTTWPLFMSVYPKSGQIYLGQKLCAELGLIQGSALSFRTSDDHIYLVRSDKRNGFILKKKNGGGLRLTTIKGVKELANMFPSEKKQKSLKLQVVDPNKSEKEFVIKIFSWDDN